MPVDTAGHQSADSGSGVLWGIDNADKLQNKANERKKKQPGLWSFIFNCKHGSWIARVWTTEILQNPSTYLPAQ